MSARIVFEKDGQEQVLEIPDETLHELARIGRRQGLSLNAALQQAVATESFLEKVIADGGKLLVKEPGEGKLRELDYA